LSRSGTHYSVVLIGAGRVGTAVALLLRKAGHRIVAVGFAGRDSTLRAAQLLNAPTCDSVSLPGSEVVLLGVPDHAIEAVSRQLAPQLAPGTFVVHFAGALGVEALEIVRDSDAVPGALHPVQSCPDVETALLRLPGSAWGVTCPSEESDRAERLVRDASGQPILVRNQDRAVWHAASATVANGTSALLAAGEAMLGAIGVSRPGEILGPLAAGTVANSVELGAASGLTGPVARGDLATVQSHLDALSERAPYLVERYRNAARLILSAADDGGRLAPETRRDVLRTLTAR
jgi:predicted short-subunit dehydrogenase-like oxidoreductase (DUF2520 family)